MTSILQFIGSAIVSLGMLFGGQTAQSPQVYGAISPAGSVVSVFETYLANAQATGDTTMTLASGALRDGSSLSGYVCFTVDSNTPTLEYECGTVSGTSVTGILRGIDATTGTTTVNSLIFAHRRGADVKITDYPALTIATNQLSGAQSIPNMLNYTYSPNYLSASTTAIASVGYVNTAFNQFQTGNWAINGTSIYNSNSGNVGVGSSTPFATFSVVGNEEHYGNYVHFGTTPANNTGCLLSSGTIPCVEEWGNDNTVGGAGVEMGIGNANAGANASSGFFWNNNLASDNLTDHYAFAGYTSSNYTDQTFGTAEATSSLLFFQNTDGAIAFMPKGGTYFYGTTASTSLQASITNFGLNVFGILSENGQSILANFGGNGVTGALSISSGTTTIALGNVPYFEADYSSISITGTAALVFTSTNPNGTIVALRSQGDCTLTSTAKNGMIDVSAIGGVGGTVGAQSSSISGMAASSTATTVGTLLSAANGGAGGASGAGGAAGALNFLMSSSSVLMKSVGAGGGGAAGGTYNNGSSTGGNGGRGAGGLYMECSGALNFTGTIYDVGANGTAGTGTTGGGGGGAGGSVLILYNTLTAKSGTITVTGGSGGNGPSGSGGGGGAGGNSPSTQGSNGVAGSSTGAGGGGATGFSLVTKNAYY